jgi:hypothetical protein
MDVWEGNQCASFLFFFLFWLQRSAIRFSGATISNSLDALRKTGGNFSKNTKIQKARSVDFRYSSFNNREQHMEGGAEYLATIFGTEKDKYVFHIFYHWMSIT